MVEDIEIEQIETIIDIELIRAHSSALFWKPLPLEGAVPIRDHRDNSTDSQRSLDSVLNYDYTKLQKLEFRDAALKLEVKAPTAVSKR